MKNVSQQNLLKNSFKIILFLLSFIILQNPIAFAGNRVSSKLYNKKGQLIADTNFIISKKQLKKFNTIEDSLIKKLILNLTQPPAFINKNDSSLEYIISFTLDQDGKFNNLHLVKISTPDQTLIFKDIPNEIQTQFSNLYLKMIQKNEAEFKRKKFKSAKGKTEEYYLPFKFQSFLNSPFKKQIINGWLFFERVKLGPTTMYSIPQQEGH